ncbi:MULTISPECIES: ABC transporter ATP-binding protein [unclassified Rhodanobacter]|uniref:ABC transporter ATP-binding protein n=1 Tax=unclassified Rhodanobacter TaxID=2621553 RepID=UPI0007A9E888|nr:MULTISPECIES: ABC transporter ATP-binding protein [unclassified Rhodanobacter]KZC17849.1 copper ABC transporter ATP-binding protein [Rhodanobacter sp. FW104-R8]KZC26073.1 copper ABC transporter ATP-binding protein [Rhodanobacter sp. FW510-T8]KZC29524.1 copper ABC transporter ATP-binding protein [Rhodanobacter sp. FW510-R10]
MNHAIEFEALAKRYGTLAALDGVSACVPRGQVIGLLGHNGAGKSTLIKLILGLIAPSSGRLDVLGQSPWRAHALRRRIGYLPESATFYASLSGRELLDYLARLKQAPRGQAQALLERVGLAHAADRRIGTYSKGMRQRLGLAQALLGSPELVLLDEPTTGLDPQATRELYRIVGELRADGRCVLISSHLLAELEPHIDGALILRQGRLLAAGSLNALGEQAALPARLLLRPHQHAVDGLLIRLDARGLPAQLRPDGRLELQVPRAGKLPMLRELLADPAVVDLDVREPTLAQLYDWLGAGQRPAAAEACA